MTSAWAATPTVDATALMRNLAGGRCRLAQALPLQERPPLQAAALAMGGRPSSLLPSLRKRRSYIPVFQIRMEKMKEVKRPPL
ncbi:hypothetical protein BHE74_00034572 [Ensete ventricosum]|nr:hypothetical protein BHE74_00034572 [Ensete ventricosum]